MSNVSYQTKIKCLLPYISPFRYVIPTSPPPRPCEIRHEFSLCVDVPPSTAKPQKLVSLEPEGPHVTLVRSLQREFVRTELLAAFQPHLLSPQPGTVLKPLAFCGGGPHAPLTPVHGVTHSFSCCRQKQV